MNKNIVIEIKNVSKAFSKNQSSSRQKLKKLFLESILGCNEQKTIQNNDFWALDNITFDIFKNEKIAIIGSNGSGKSTLLKMFNGIFLPDKGTITIKGRVNSILELSSGFKPELSGRENIYLKFSLLGKDKKEVDQIIHDVITFSELQDFIDTPLKHYSSGMKSKLGFSIVSTFEPEILILDEVFAAGDKNFRKKSEKRIQELYENTTTIFVTHSMSIVKKIANRVIIIDKGKKVFDGKTLEGIDFYNNLK
jgi:lipopolysaccharide transport system ATP-binding protein